MKWTIQVMTKDGQRTAGEYDTKREAVTAMEAMREPKTRINRIGRSYIISERKQ